MTTAYIQAGDVMGTYISASAITAGQIVNVGCMLGVALTSAAANAECTVMLEGVFMVQKTTGTAITRGTKLLWKAGTNKFSIGTASAVTGDIIGNAVCWSDAASGDTTMRVLFTGAPGTIT